jgi:solute carrier family 35 (UDP-sugar transporter), member A1/2/3
MAKNKLRIQLQLTFRNAILLVLCLQNAGFTLLRSYSQSVLKEEYNYSSLLLVGEFIKLLVSSYMTGWGSGKDEDTDIKHMSGVPKLIWLAKNSQKMLMLAGIYGVMNIFSFISLARIDAVEFTVASQLKILATACFFVILFKRPLTDTKWRALVLLVCGTILVSNPDAKISSKNEDSSGNSNEFGSKLIGYGAVLIQVALSGFAAVYFEKVIKSSTEKLSIWDRNVQLAGASIAFYFSTFLWEAIRADPNKKDIENNGSSGGGGGFFKGWSFITLLLACLSAGGGILVALTFKHADSILKTLAVSLAIVLTTFTSWAMLGSKLNITVVIGAISAIIGVLNYNYDATPKKNAIEEKKNDTVNKNDTSPRNSSPTRKKLDSV